MSILLTFSITGGIYTLYLDIFKASSWGGIAMYITVAFIILAISSLFGIRKLIGFTNEDEKNGKALHILNFINTKIIPFLLILGTLQLILNLLL